MSWKNLTTKGSATILALILFSGCYTQLLLNEEPVTYTNSQDDPGPIFIPVPCPPIIIINCPVIPSDNIVTKPESVRPFGSHRDSNSSGERTSGGRQSSRDR